MISLADLTIEERLETLSLKQCRPLPDAKTAISFALSRFHEAWSAYRSITPTLYGIGDGRGVYVTLGTLRRSYGLSWQTVEGVVEVLEHHRPLTGYLLATEAVGGDPLNHLFGLQGHDYGEKQYGALDLATLTPFETTFTTELDVTKEAWRDLQQQAAANNPFLTKPSRVSF